MVVEVGERGGLSTILGDGGMRDCDGTAGELGRAPDKFT